MRTPWKSISDERELFLYESRRLIVRANADIVATQDIVQESRLRIQEGQSLSALVETLIDRAWRGTQLHYPPKNKQ